MKIRKGFVVRKVGDAQYAVATGDALKYFKGMIKLNEMGAFMFTLLQEETTAEQITERIEKSFEGDHEKIMADIENFVATLRGANVLED